MKQMLLAMMVSSSILPAYVRAQVVSDPLGSRASRDLFSDPGLPHLAWDSSTAVRVYGREVLLNGFRVRGTYSRSTDVVKPFPLNSSGYNVYDYQIAREGYSAPNFTQAGEESWVAAFAVAKPSDSNARVLLAPWLKVSSWDAASKTATISALGGTMSGNFSGAEALIAQESGKISGKILTVETNTATTVTFKSGIEGVTLASGDYLLLSPGTTGANYEFKYLRTLKLDRGIGSPNYEWRNFVFNGYATHSYHGGYGSDITNEGTWTELDFRDKVSPLATGLIGTGQAYITSSAGTAAYLYLGQDSSNHTIVTIGVDRTSAANDGVTAPFWTGFNREKQSLWGQVNESDNVVGRVTIMGWTED